MTVDEIKKHIMNNQETITISDVVWLLDTIDEPKPKIMHDECSFKKLIKRIFE